MLRAHGQWDNGNGGLAPTEEPPSQTSSGRTPLAGQSAIKRISLADYKNRDKSKAAVAPEAKSQSFEAKAELKMPAETKQPSTIRKQIAGRDSVIKDGTNPHHAERSGQEWYVTTLSNMGFR